MLKSALPFGAKCRGNIGLLNMREQLERKE